jgi:hypothetical protein
VGARVIGSGSEWEWDTVGVFGSGSGSEWDWTTQVGVDETGQSKWEWMGLDNPSPNDQIIQVAIICIIY